jgi:ferredoxin--NADP+ reductase
MNKPGDVAVKVLLLPEDLNAPLICVATGTGIAPYRSFWRRCFYEDVPSYKFTGLFWLFMGAANGDAMLYDNEIQEIAATHPDQFRVDYALSREMKNKKGGKMYIQDKMEEYADELFDLLDNGAHIYFCGLKGVLCCKLGLGYWDQQEPLAGRALRTEHVQLGHNGGLRN